MGGSSRETACTRTVAAILLSGAVLAGCGAPGEEAATRRDVQSSAPESGRSAQAASTGPPSPLAGTEWRLIEIQSMDDAVGTSRPDDPSRYVMRLNGDGTVALRLHCNSTNGTWFAEAGADLFSGRFEFGPLAATRALCPSPSLDERVAKEARYIRSYLLKDGRLHFHCLADGGIQVWEPLAEEPFQTKPEPDLETAILRASPSYTRALVDVEGGVGRGRYVYGRVDLNGDGREGVRLPPRVDLLRDRRLRSTALHGRHERALADQRVPDQPSSDHRLGRQDHQLERPPAAGIRRRGGGGRT